MNCLVKTLISHWLLDFIQSNVIISVQIWKNATARQNIIIILTLYFDLFEEKNKWNWKIIVLLYSN